jgi:hypothetical protein
VGYFEALITESKRPRSPVPKLKKKKSKMEMSENSAGMQSGKVIRSGGVGLPERKCVYLCICVSHCRMWKCVCILAP